jgi:hypothetical protein
MKTSSGKNSSLTTLAVAVGVGCLIGVFVPLPQPGKPLDVEPRSARPREEGAEVAKKDLEVPETITGEWAVECANSRPDEFFRWLLKADPQPSGEVVSKFFETWISRNPDAAFQAALRLPSRFGYSGSSGDIYFFKSQLQQTFVLDPGAALRWAGRVEGVICQGGSMGWSEAVYGKLEKLDPKEVRAQLNGYPVGGVSSAMAVTYALFLVDKDANEGLRWATSLGVEHQNAALPMVLHQLKEKDPGAALDYIKSAPSNIKQYGALYALGNGSASLVLEEMKWLADEMGVSSYTGLNNMMNRLYNADHKVAQDYVESIGERSQQLAAVRGLAEAASDKREDMAVLIGGLPDDLQLEAATVCMRKRMPSWYPDFLERMNDGSIREANMDGYIHQMATFVDSDLVRQIMSSNNDWKPADSEDLPGFQNWIKDNPGPRRDQFIREAYKLFKDKPEVLNKAFGQMPAEELKRILEAGR